MLNKLERMDKRIAKKVNKVVTAIDEYIDKKGVTSEKERLGYYETFLHYMDRSTKEPVETEDYRFLSILINNQFSVLSSDITYEDILFYNEVVNQLSNKVYDVDVKTGRIKKRSLML